MIVTDKLSQQVNKVLSGRCSASNTCPVKDIMASVCDKWSMYTVLLLGREKHMRFSELRAGISGISQRMLTVTLRSLEKDGIVARHIANETASKVEYSLTVLGNSLLLQLLSFGTWAENNFEAILQARKTYQADHK